MANPTGFLEYQRRDRSYDPVEDRLKHYREFVRPLPQDELRRQGGRCMDCGTPFCHHACPVNNIIPDWNDLTYRNDPRAALAVLHRTNNFPDVTGRVCPAPCEAACTLNLIEQPVTIKTIEHAIIERGWEEGWVEPVIAPHRTGKRVAVVGSGPSGLACAQQLARAGHDVAVYEKASRIGGLLRYGIPDFKLEKNVIDRRIAQMRAEGVEFHPNAHIGVSLPIEKLMHSHHAVVLAIGAEVPRDLPVPGRELAGIHFAMDFLTQQNRRVGGERVAGEDILATGKHVLVIGGGDTGSDCIGTSNRQGAKSVTQIEILPVPPEHEDKLLTWPDWPMKLRTSSSQEEGIRRDWSVSTKCFTEKDGHVKGLSAVRVEWRTSNEGRPVMEEVPDSHFEIRADLVLLAMGFLHPQRNGAVAALKLALDPRGNLKADTDHYRGSVDKVFCCGDARRGQSLVVWAIREGRQCARAVDEYLMGSSDLPR
ncbi:MAG TPA: glutamate synthase subunit beta [Stellaceae bacterium]|jgi:glutamate synthase (NADPH/NADH) small chain|nr:glutamate synthase subunit beta [Stellaceae bacterium]